MKCISVHHCGVCEKHSIHSSQGVDAEKGCKKLQGALQLFAVSFSSPLCFIPIHGSLTFRKTAVDNGWQFKMVEEGGTFLTDYEWAPHLAKNHVLSQTAMIPGSKVVDSSGCNFHFASGIMKDSKQILFLSGRLNVVCYFW